jgi:hypothetical protein
MFQVEVNSMKWKGSIFILSIFGHIFYFEMLLSTCYKKYYSSRIDNEYTKQYIRYDTVNIVSY